MDTYTLNNKEKSPFLPLIALSLIFILLQLSSLNAMESGLRVVGQMAILFLFAAATLYLFTFLMFNKSVPKSHMVIFCLSLLYTIIGVLNLSKDFSGAGLGNVIQFLACIGFFLFISKMKWDASLFKVLYVLTAIFIVLHLLIWIAEGRPHFFSSIYNNSNLMGPYMFYLSYFILAYIITNRHYILPIIFLILALILTNASDTRSIFIAIGAAIITYFLWPILTQTLPAFLMFFIIVISVAISVLFIYPILPTLKGFNEVDAWMIEVTGKRIMSGREYIWQFLTNLIAEHPYMGHGPGTVANDYLASGKSAHNLYIQIMLQSGYIGLLIIVIILLVIWAAFYNGRSNPITRLSGAFLISIIAHQCFEITFFQNQLSIGLIQWFTLGVGLSAAFNTLNKNKPLNSEN